MKTGTLIVAMTLPASFALADGKVVASFSGTGPTVTEPFVVDDGWDLHWDAEARRFQVTVFDMDSQIPSIAVDQVQVGGGTRQYVEGGRFRLDVHANGPWIVEISQ